jgi:hypothetical protein
LSKLHSQLADFKIEHQCSTKVVLASQNASIVHKPERKWALEVAHAHLQPYCEVQIVVQMTTMKPANWFS